MFFLLRLALLALFSGFIFFSVRSQETSNLKFKEILWIGDSIVIDSLSLVPGSVELRDADMRIIDTGLYTVRYYKSTIYFKNSGLGDVAGKSVKLYYRTYPFNLSRQFRHKDIALIEQDQTNLQSPFIYTIKKKEDDFFEMEGLNKSGSISRGVSLGNNQDLAVNSNLDLQLSGKVTEDVKILAAISDGNLPIQPEGNTQQLQEFDRVYIQLYNEKYSLIAGDYRMNNDESNYFLRYNKSLQGGSAEALFKSNPVQKNFKRDETYFTKVSAAVSKGKFAINKIQGIEGNQGPYLLRGAENESFIVVISGTEKVYIDGKLLKRGQNYDYIIDYNSAELTFTPNQIITKDKRITIEFQYSDRFYSRTLFHVKSAYSNEKLELEVNYYNEGDSKNQTLDRDLTDAEKQALGNTGDSLNNAIVPNIREDTSADLSSEILYKLVYRTDPNGPDSFFVYSIDPDSAIWRVGFSDVGDFQGDYNLASTDANGKVYEFIPRDLLTGQPQGRYMPITTLATPKRRQLVTVGGKVKLSDESEVAFETAYSHNDINTFSSIDDNDNNGFAGRIDQNNSFALSNDSLAIHFDAGINYEVVSKNFKEIERFRSVEFYRDWNLPQPLDAPQGLERDQNLLAAYVGFSKEKRGLIRYTVSTFQDKDFYTGINNKVNAAFSEAGFEAKMTGSIMNSESDIRTSFLRYRGIVSQKLYKVKVGVEFDEENSQLKSKDLDSLYAGSFRWSWWQVFLTNADSTENYYKVSYRNRYDYLPDSTNSSLRSVTFAEDVGFDLQLLKNAQHQFLTKVTYRKLQVVDEELYADGPEENILGKIDYQGLFINRMVTWQTYYEVGSGLEIKREIQFQGPLNPGQGTYIWKDLNDDGVQQKNEFFLAPTPEEGIYARVLLPTNEFERAYTNTYNQVVFIKPEVLLGTKKGMLKALSYLSNRLTYRIDKKSNEDNVYNPFDFNFESDSLLSLGNSILNTFYINRLGSVFGIELNYGETNNRNLFISGKESRATQNKGIRTRWNITQEFTLNSEYEEGRSFARSENFENRDFDILSDLVKSEFYYQPGVSFRIGLNYEYKIQENDVNFGDQRALSNNMGTELRYNVAQKGTFQLNVNYIIISFEGINDPVITQEMLEGLQSGRNATWNLIYQRNLGKYMQLSVNYSGRQSEGSRMVHLGGAQVRAFF